MDTKERDQLIAQMLSEGKSLGDIQKTLEQEHDVKITYMELRLISADLEVDWKKVDEEAEEPAKPIPDLSQEAEPEAAAGDTQVNISQVVRPGALFSGDVTFKSGAKAEWSVDRMGQLSLNPVGEARPTQDDLQEFQVELQNILQQKMGGGAM